MKVQFRDKRKEDSMLASRPTKYAFETFVDQLLWFVWIEGVRGEVE